MPLQVALGKMKTFSMDRHVETELPAGFDSLHARGNVGPNFSKSVVLPNGVKIPTEMRPSYVLIFILFILCPLFPWKRG